MNAEAHPILYEGRLVKLRRAIPPDYPLLHRWRCDPGEIHYLCRDPSTMVYREFAKWLGETQRQNIVTLILNKADDRPIGYALTYAVDLWDGWVYLALYVIPEFRLRRHFVEASLVAADYLFSRFPLRKMYVEIYDFADRLLAHLRRQGYVEEGFTPNHLRHGDGYTGLWTLALYRETWERGRPWIEHWLPSGGTDSLLAFWGQHRP